MNFNPIEQMRDLMHADGINFHLFEADLAGLPHFDDGLRSQIFLDYDYSDIRMQLQTHCLAGTLHGVTDTFATSYLVFRPDLPDGSYAIIGPYLLQEAQEVLPQVMARCELPFTLHTELKFYYYGVPVVADPEKLIAKIRLLLQYVWGSSDFPFVRDALNFNQTANREVRQEPGTKLSMAMLEERYKNEDYMLAAIERGDVQTALMHLGAFRKFHIEPRNTDLLRNYKSFYIVLNSLLRKTVQKAAVHPAHIDALSGAYSQKIEQVTALEDLSRLSPEMLQQYSLLVQTHSLRAYSKPIQHVINTVDFHLAEQLSLKRLAESAQINPSYLSTQFKKETGKNLTDYINSKRIEKAVQLLDTTSLPINRVAEQVGILDENYFSRLFRKLQGVTPREHRSDGRPT